MLDFPRLGHICCHKKNQAIIKKQKKKMTRYQIYDFTSSMLYQLSYDEHHSNTLQKQKGPFQHTLWNHVQSHLPHTYVMKAATRLRMTPGHDSLLYVIPAKRLASQ